MSLPVDDAADHLRTIRSLMERAVVYRAVSGPAALAAGLLSWLVCAVLHLTGVSSSAVFAAVWLTVLAGVSALNFILLSRSARSRGEPFISSGMKMALRAVAPPMLAGFVLSMLSLSRNPHAHAEITAAWILFYGLALLSMNSFAPKSMLALGGGFFVSGLLVYLFSTGAAEARQYPFALTAMALTFGLLHILYAAAVFLVQRRTPPELSAVSPAGE